MKTRTQKWLLTLIAVGGVALSAVGIVPYTNGRIYFQETGEEDVLVLAQAQSPSVEAEDPGARTNSAVTGERTSSVAERKSSGTRREAVVSIGKDVELKEGDSAQAVVVIGGSAKIRGKVHDAAVAIGGSLDIEGDVGNAAVAVLGDIHVKDGAKIHGEAVSVGGKVDVAPGGTVQGQVQEVDLSAFGMPAPEWIKSWVVHCLLKMRPLAPQVAWPWAVAGVVLLFYLLVSVLMPRPVQACVRELTERPATTFFMGLLTKMLLPIIIIVLFMLVIGVVVVPFLGAALLMASIIGKVAVLHWLGLSLGNRLHLPALQKPLPAFFVGAVVLCVLYMIPVLGALSFFVFAIWGLGAAVTAAAGGMRRETPSRPAPQSPSGGAPVPTPPTPAPSFVAPVPPLTGDIGGAGGTVLEAQAGPASDAASPVSAPVPIVPETLVYPKASFWERMGAGFLDIVLVSILSGFVGGAPLGFLVALAYFAGMWAWKGTTIGGIVIGLKVVRVDGQPVSFVVGLVRGLAAAFSIVVLFLGFLWIAWDTEKQGWHDKIAGTVVLRLPRGTPLVCI